jgi:tetratricopeptide (TPR) repeat protein
LLEEGRIPHLMASLRKDQRQLAETVLFLDQALLVAGPGERKKILINRANTLELMGDFEEAISTLQSIPLSSNEDSRLEWFVRFTLTNNLLQTRRVEEAALALPRLKELLAEFGNDLDALRLRWLEGRIAAGMNKPKESIAILVQVREDLVSRKLAYDAALISLEMAYLFMGSGEMPRVQMLSRQMLWIFSSQGVHREAIAALRFFCEATEKETLTADLVRRLVAYLQRARYDPELRFEP